MTNQKIPLDWDGLQLLAGAIYLREVYIYRELVRQEYFRRNNPIESEYWGDLLSGKPLDFRKVKKGVNYRKFRLCGYPQWEPPKMGRDGRPPEGLLKKAAKLKVTDLRFEWFHLFAEKSLIKYVKPIVPKWAQSAGFIDRETPIAQRWGDDLTEALIRLHDHEYSRLNNGWAYTPKDIKDGEGPFDVVPCNPGEIEFGILVADICEIPEPKKRGPKSGSGKNIMLKKEVLAYAKELAATPEYIEIGPMPILRKTFKDLGIEIGTIESAGENRLIWITAANGDDRKRLESVLTSLIPYFKDACSAR